VNHFLLAKREHSCGTFVPLQTHVCEWVFHFCCSCTLRQEHGFQVSGLSICDLCTIAGSIVQKLHTMFPR
jgi:hypothetical protein